MVDFIVEIGTVVFRAGADTVDDEAVGIFGLVVAAIACVIFDFASLIIVS